MGKIAQVRPSAPTACLPPLARLPSCSLDRIAEALANLQILYLPSRSLQQNILLKSKHLPGHLIHDTSVPDSGYASEEDEDDSSDDDGEAIELLRADSFERDFAVRWLTGFAARSETWVYLHEEEEEARASLVDDAAALLAFFAGEEEEVALTRKFVFQLGQDGKETLEVELNDAPLLSDDYTSVGLQSWASSIHLGERMSSDPDAWGFIVPGKEIRLLELGAGTGLVSIVAAKLMQATGQAHKTIATDFHPSVLDNLQANVNANFPASPSPSPIDVLKLDWEHPEYDAPLDKPFDVIMAADVIYHPEHANWIKSCVEHSLLRPSSALAQDGGVFWLIFAVRSTGRHEGLASTVSAVFPQASVVTSKTPVLAILESEDIGKQSGVGRADESAYTLCKIGWVQARVDESS
ncbi:hypothetical protein EIP91_011843 [Steccherinum ochraceum]|uniref:S-adenosylmethionine-dependent methyltransferase n=1 Tax=Steccherinum ochraceum TaxID=92696 RepID=A0A4R0RR58_9APHY|nr:hypothetical protein EIP91_011843 [Steccherinum ochraceum]